MISQTSSCPPKKLKRILNIKKNMRKLRFLMMLKKVRNWKKNYKIARVAAIVVVTNTVNKTILNRILIQMKIKIIVTVAVQRIVKMKILKRKMRMTQKKMLIQL